MAKTIKMKDTGEYRRVSNGHAMQLVRAGKAIYSKKGALKSAINRKGRTEADVFGREYYEEVEIEKDGKKKTIFRKVMKSLAQIFQENNIEEK